MAPMRGHTVDAVMLSGGTLQLLAQSWSFWSAVEDCSTQACLGRQP